MKKSRIATAIIASIYFIYYSCTYTQWHFIDNVNLLIHEAGHVIFMFFGTFMHIAGGSLSQVLFPAVFVYYFYHRQEYFSASLVLFWVGQNILNVSVYAADAVAMQLPLLGGDTAGHDWHNMLDMLGLLQQTDAIGLAIRILGMCVIFSAVYLSCTFALSETDESKPIPVQ